MKRRSFLATTVAAAAGGWSARAGAFHDPSHGHDACGPTYATPADAIRSERERLMYVTAPRVGTVADQPDYLATVDVDPESKEYGTVIHRVFMPNSGDELHHFGWNACSSCHADPTKHRRYLIVPGFASSRLHILDAADARQPQLHHVIEPEEIIAKTGLTTPHTVHCLPDGQIMISMLGDAQRQAPGGFLLLDADFKVAGRWEPDASAMQFNYDFWYQPRQGVMVSSEWAAPATFSRGFNLEDVKAGKYGNRLLFWDWKTKKLLKADPLGPTGLIPLEVRFHHNPDSTDGYVAAALSSTVWRWHRAGGEWKVEKVIEEEPVEIAGFPFPVPGLITDILVSMDDRWLYLSNWLHGDIRQYDLSDPSKPRLAGRAWCGGLLKKGQKHAGKTLQGGPQMLQLSLDGNRLYVTNSLYSVWDDQFYPEMAKAGSAILKLDCNTESGGITLDEKFYVDFGQEPGGPARAHEMRFPGGDCTSDIWA
jgi:selenium-binding protein 1